MSENAVSTDAFALGQTVTVAGVEIRVARETWDAGFKIGRRHIAPSDGDAVVFECQVRNSSDEAIRLPTRNAFDMQGRALPNLESHHFHDGTTVRPSYFRLAAAYGDALVTPDTTVSGLVAYEPADDSAEPEVSITVDFADEERTLTWHLTPTDTGDEADRKTPTPDSGRSKTPAVTSDSQEETQSSSSVKPSTTIHSQNTQDSDDADGSATESSDRTNADAPISKEDAPSKTDSLRCPDCDEPLSPSHDYCGNCGASL